MKCANFESIVNDLVRNQIMEAGTREQALLHSSTCTACATRLNEEQELTQGLQSLTESMRDEFAPGDIEPRLAVAFREHHAASKPLGNISAPVYAGRVSRLYWNYAAAAGVLLAVALGIAASRFWRSEFSTVPVTDKDATVALPPTRTDAVSPDSETDSPATVKPSDQTPPVRPSRRALASRARAARYSVTVESLNVMAPVAEVTTEFIPIGYSNSANVQEGGQVVRLEMPRYAMARFGVPINEERYAEMVKADVWVGADGLARAIRFVQ